MPLESSLNDANKALLERLQNVTEINLAEEPGMPCWQVATTYKISAPNAEPNPSAMAHELLHIQLQIKGFAENNIILYNFNHQNTAFTPEFIGPMNNNLAHFKMIDDFISMGYSVDDFLQDTPKEYFLKDMIFTTTVLMLKFKTGSLELCKEILEIIHLIAGAKLFELYKMKDPSTENGLHPDAVLVPLKEISAELVTEIENLFEEWIKLNTINNLWFYQILDSILKKHGVPNHEECLRAQTINI